MMKTIDMIVKFIINYINIATNMTMMPTTGTEVILAVGAVVIIATMVEIVMNNTTIKSSDTKVEGLV